MPMDRSLTTRTTRSKTPTLNAVDASLRAVIQLERLVLRTARLEGVVQRYGFFYGPGTAWTQATAPSPRVSVASAAQAAFLAVDRGPPGIYNIVDDDEAVSNRHARKLLGWTP